MSLNLNEVEFIGTDLVRPECVLVTAAGNKYVSDFRGGVTQIAPNGACTFFGGEEIDGIGLLKPNGICLLPDGSFLVAHLGDTQGGVYKVNRDNRIEPYLTEIDGEAIPPSNFIYLDHQGRLWLTVSTRTIPRAAAYRSDVEDGYIALIDKQGARIVADGIGYTNEVYIPPSGEVLYANATFARETLAYDIDVDGELSNRRTVASYGRGIYPDGLTMDTEGQLWITSIVSNSVLRVNPESGESEVFLQDVDQAHLTWVEKAYLEHRMGRAQLDQVKSKRLKNMSSLAFGGERLNIAYMGCLLGQELAQIQTKYHGHQPAHWHVDDKTACNK